MGGSLKIEKYTLFIDAQNLYSTARRAFFLPEDSSIYGQINPLALAKLIESRAPQGITKVLHEVRIYTGRPDPEKEPKTHSAHMRQCNAWEKAGVKVMTRQLRYLNDWPSSKAQQKGIDVALAIDFVALAADQVHDIGILASLDTDLIPALEFVHERFGTKCKIEVVGFRTKQHQQRIRLPGANIWCNLIDRTDYDAIADLTKYGVAEPHEHPTLF